MEHSAADAHLVTEGVCAAVRAGYRALDLAEHYASSKGGHIGEAIDQLASEGVPRSELWLTHKIDGMPTGEYGEIKARVEEMLALARTDYLDCLLIHYPMPRGTDLSGDPSTISTQANFDWFVAHIDEAWENMQNLKQEGLVKHIGVSNFYAQHLEELAKYTSVSEMAKCFANEIFIDAAHPCTKTVNYCRSNGIVVMAYRPTAFLMNLGLLDGAIDALTAMAEERGLESIQELIIETLCLRGGIIPITGARDPKHMAANLRASASKGGDAAAPRLPADLSFVEEQAEMVEMMGGVDEYAQAFARMGVQDVPTLPTERPMATADQVSRPAPTLSPSALMTSHRYVHATCGMHKSLVGALRRAVANGDESELARRLVGRFTKRSAVVVIAPAVGAVRAMSLNGLAEAEQQQAKAQPFLVVWLLLDPTDIDSKQTTFLHVNAAEPWHMDALYKLDDSDEPIGLKQKPAFRPSEGSIAEEAA